MWFSRFLLWKMEVLSVRHLFQKCKFCVRQNNYANFGLIFFGANKNLIPGQDRFVVLEKVKLPICVLFVLDYSVFLFLYYHSTFYEHPEVRILSRMETNVARLCPPLCPHCAASSTTSRRLLSWPRRLLKRMWSRWLGRLAMRCSSRLTSRSRVFLIYCSIVS